jgi:hypothetical protein
MEVYTQDFYLIFKYIKNTFQEAYAPRSKNAMHYRNPALRRGLKVVGIEQYALSVGYADGSPRRSSSA